MQAAWFRKNGFVPQRNLYVNNLVVLADLVQLGLGIGLLPEVHYRPEIRSGKLVKKPDPGRGCEAARKSLQWPPMKTPVAPCP